MKLNQKGFTLVEVLAVIVILSVLMAIMVPNIGNLLKKNKEQNYKDFENSIISASKIYLSDNRYNVIVNSTDCDDTDTAKEVNVYINKKASDNETSDTIYVSKLPLKVLVDAGNLKTTSDHKILNPLIQSQTLDLEQSYVLVKYSCQKKDYRYSLNEENQSTLKWNTK